MCRVTDARERLTEAAIAIARLIGEDPDGATLDAAEAEFKAADAEFMACWEVDAA